MQNMTTNGENKVQRFIVSGHDSVMTPFACGDWVSYDDYILLKAEVEETRKGSGAGMRVMLDLNNQLVAEVEHLRKAGDAMAGVIGLPVNDVQTNALVDNWNAAKEGKPQS